MNRTPRALLLVFAAALAAGCAGRPDVSDRAWPFWNREETAGGAERLDVMWPIRHVIETPERRDARFRPLYRRIEEGLAERTEVLWPLFIHTEEPGSSSTTVFPAFHHRRWLEDDGTEDLDWLALPLFAGGSDEAGDYFLFFPFWGNVRQWFGKDEMRFRFFPLYLDARAEGYESTHLLWPIVSWGEGDGRSDFRILPFYAHREDEGKGEWTSVLWPFVSWGREALDTKHPAESLVVFPFYGETESDVAWSRFVLFPAYMASGADGGYLDLNLLWPVFRRRTGPDGPQALRVWPFFSRTRDEAAGAREDWYLWPFVWDADVPDGDGRLRSTQVVPFYRRRVRTTLDGAFAGSETQIWPLFRRREAADGSVWLTALAPLPFVELEPLEAAWSWLWTIADYRSAGDAVSFDLLGGFFQYRGGPDGTYAGVPLLLEYAAEDGASRVQLLKGILGYESERGDSGVRLLWFLRIG